MTYEKALEMAMAAAAKAGDITTLPPHLRTVALIHAAQGTIDNGGLQYFFEADFPHTPDYALFVQAYRNIGSHDAADTLESAVALFPFNSPHMHLKKRNQFLDSFLGEDGDPLNSPFQPFTKKLCGNKSVWQNLKVYITTHAAQFSPP